MGAGETGSDGVPSVDGVRDCLSRGGERGFPATGIGKNPDDGGDAAGGSSRFTGEGCLEDIPA
ncbi:MAG: hypothetical protein B7Y25_08140, partial [Alphaproteobacteria bacterium 16-39-46]